ncbi:hypothetical protein [Myroides sp. DW712]|uniref:hypothetical protein n=1 Tax=Myroides sp. DW712 TaxID=3389800 RepID=UPI0039791B40
MKYTILFYPGILVVVMALVSCGSTQTALVYADEYQTSIAFYQDTVNPQLYYNIDKNIHLIDEGSQLPTSKGAN